MKQEKRSAGSRNRLSNQSNDLEFIVVGRLRRPHGLNGEILMDIITDFPDRLKARRTVYVGEAYHELHISQARWQPPSMLLTFEEFTDCDAVGKFRNKLLYVRADSLPDLPEGEYYHHQLIGLTVIDKHDQKILGTLTEILETGANDVYLVKTEKDDELLIPVVEGIILEIDLHSNTMIVDPPEWR